MIFEILNRFGFLKALSIEIALNAFLAESFVFCKYIEMK